MGNSCTGRPGCVGAGRLLVACLGLLVVASGAAGQAVDYDGAKPAKPLVGSRSVRWAICVRDGATLRSAPRDSAPEVGGSRTKLFKSLAMFRLHGGEQAPDYVLVGQYDDYDERIISIDGWMSTRDCLLGLEPLKTKDWIKRKAVVLNRFEDERGRDAKSAINVVRAFSGPDSTQYRSVHELRIFEFCFIYGEAKAADGADYVLLGRKSLIDNPESAGDCLIGWVRRERIQEWDTRQAIYFNKTNRKQRPNAVGIYDSRDKLLAQMGGRSGKVEPIAVETDAEEQLDPKLMRFPLLESFMPQHGGPRLMRIAFIGDQYEIDGGGMVISGLEASRQRRQMEEMRRQMRSIDVLICIDATGSMIKYFGHIAKAVENILRAIREQQAGDTGTSMQVSIVFYRDYYDEVTDDAHRKTIKRLELTSNIDKAVDFIRTEPVRLGEGINPAAPKELTEAVFYGVLEGLDRAEFRKNSYRQVIVIGDYGNHQSDPRGYRPSHVAKKLIEKRANFLALHVAAADTVRHIPAARWFEEQTREIAKSVVAAKEMGLIGEYSARPDATELGKMIYEYCEQGAKNTQRMDEAMQALMEGKSTEEIKGQYGVQFTSHLTRRLADSGIDVSVLRKKRAMVSQEGWIAERDPVSGLAQVEPWILISRASLTRLAAILDRISRQSFKPNTVRQTWKSVLNEHLFIPPDDRESIDEIIKQRLGLPIRTNVLRYSLAELAELDGRDLRRVHEQVKEAKDKLYAHNANYNIWFSVDREQYAWIRMEDLP